MTVEDLLSIGFKQIPHMTIGNIVYYDLGRGRQISAGSVGTPNEMFCLCQQDSEDERFTTDIICLKNYDYDGYTSIETVQQLINSITTIK